MPHQCLKCGKVFEEGSSQLLKGCESCGGNRFFFTKEPLNEQERKEMMERLGKDIDSAITELMDDVIDNSGNWVKVKPTDIRKAMKKHMPEKQEIAADKTKVTDEEYRKALIEKIKAESKKSDTPGTIDVEAPGKYKIDLKGLLEEEPIIIQKDGSYTIHLPSVFKMLDKEKKN
jgi:predicted  nucleic acid-binding Zn-ribbon protein